MKHKIILLIIIIVLIIISIIYLVFFAGDKDASTFVSVPVANNNISKYEEITEDDIKYISVYSEIINTDQIITDASGIIGKYASSNIVEGDFFYNDLLVADVFSIEEHDNLFELTIPSEYQYLIWDYETIDIWLNGTEGNNVISEVAIEDLDILYYLDTNGNIIIDDEIAVSSIMLNVSDEIVARLEELAINYTLYPVISG